MILVLLQWMPWKNRCDFLLTSVTWFGAFCLLNLPQHPYWHPICHNSTIYPPDWADPPYVELPNKLILYTTSFSEYDGDIHVLVHINRRLHSLPNFYLCKHTLQYRKATAQTWAARRGVVSTFRCLTREPHRGTFTMKYRAKTFDAILAHHSGSKTGKQRYSRTAVG